MTRARLTGFVFALLALLSASQAAAIMECTDCSCGHSCSTSCVTDTGWSNCGNTGICSGASGCGGGGCLTSSEAAAFLQALQAPKGVSPAEQDRGRVAARLTWRLAQHVEENGLGAVYSGETGFRLSAKRGKAQAADLAFVSQERLAGAGSLRSGSPDLAAEILASPALAPAMEGKVRSWLAAGTRAVLVIDPAAKTVAVHRGRAGAQTFTAEEILALPDIVPGWVLRIGDLFE